MFYYSQNIHMNVAFHPCALAGEHAMPISVPCDVSLFKVIQKRGQTWINVFPQPACAQVNGRSPV